VFHDWNRSTKLDVAALGLEGRELEIAQILAQETEAEREAEFAALPEISSDEAAAIIPPGPFLLVPPSPKTVAQVRRESIDAIAWDALLRRGGAHSRCAVRTGLDLVEVIEFAIDKCQPSNWEALFWYQQWAREALREMVPREAVELIAKKHKEESAAAAAYARSKQGASAGGKKSSEVRRLKSKLPSPEVLQGDRERLLADRTAPREVAGKLARKYGVTPTTVRAKLAEIDKEK
jgi:hypothetical protein